MRCTKRDIARYLVSLLLLAVISHATASVVANNHVLALSQAACDHCQIILANESVDYQPVNLAASFEPLPDALPQFISLARVQAYQCPAVLVKKAPFPSKVRLHLLHCVMRD